MKKIAILIVVLSVQKLFSQITYDKGYFIKDSGEKVECFIKNLGWLNSPASLEYKLSENTAPILISTKNVKEFGIKNYLKFEKFSVDINQSSNKVRRLDDKREPVYKNETVLLKYELESNDVSLLTYTKHNVLKFFLKKGNKVSELVYKVYEINNIILKNPLYKRQLFYNLKCNDFNLHQIDRARYKSKEFEKIVKNYYKCKGEDYIEYGIKKVNKNEQEISRLNVFIRPNVNFTALSVKDDRITSRNFDFSNKTTFGFEAEIEYILPYNRNKWSIFLNPSFLSYNNRKNDVDIFNNNPLLPPIDIEVTLNTLEIPVGIKHHMYVNNTNKLNIGLSYAFNFDMDSKFDFIRENYDDLEVNTSGNLMLTLGYTFKNKFDVNVKIRSDKDLFKNSSWTSSLNIYSLSIGYNLL